MQNFPHRIKPQGPGIRQIAAALTDHMRRYGYQRVETPIIEDADLFLAKAGDMIAEKLFTFEHRGHNLALRPEFTAAAAHLYNRQNRQDTVRWQFSGPIFEDNGGQYQHFSAGAELIGSDGPAADAEIISMAVQGLARLNITNWKLVIGHVGLTRHLLSQFSLDSRTERFILNRRGLLLNGEAGIDALTQALERYLPRRAPAANQGDPLPVIETMLDTGPLGGTMGGRSRQDIARRLLDKRQQIAQRDQIDAAMGFLRQWIDIEGTPETAFAAIRRMIQDESTAGIVDSWRASVTLLDAYDLAADRITIQPDLVRVWDYYTGMVFELRLDDGTVVAGGGRYNDLTRLMGSTQATPAVGFAYYVDRLEAHIPAEVEQPVYTLAADPNALKQAIHWADRLRQRGYHIAMRQVFADMHVDASGVLHIDEQTYTLDQIDTVTLEAKS